jgi:glycine reductase
MKAKKAVYYINQFYAGLGGEEKANVGLNIYDGVKGPGIGLEKLWDGKIKIVKTISCGDNYVNKEKNFKKVWLKIKEIIEAIKPDIFIAGPAFGAGRYGVACAKLCDYVRKNLNIPSVTAMYYENPAVPIYVKDNYIIASSGTALGMKKVLPAFSALSLKLANREKIGPARIEGYIPTGHRYNSYHQIIGATRVVDMLLKKLKGEDYFTEIPLRKFEKVKAAAPLKDMKIAIIALITTGGLVLKNNPDKLRQAFSVTYAKYNIKDLDFIPAGDYESIHGGYDTTLVNKDPNRLVPLDELRILEKEHYIKGIYKNFFTTCGIGTKITDSINIGKDMAKELLENGVNGVILTST